MQKRTEAQDTVVRSGLEGTLTGRDQLSPRSVSAVPSAVTATQTRVRARHDTPPNPRETPLTRRRRDQAVPLKIVNCPPLVMTPMQRVADAQETTGPVI